MKWSAIVRSFKNAGTSVLKDHNVSEDGSAPIFRRQITGVKPEKPEINSTRGPSRLVFCLPLT